MHVTNEMGHPRQRYGALWQWGTAIGQDGTLLQESFKGAYAIRAVLGTTIMRGEGQIDIVALIVCRQHARLAFVYVWPVGQDLQGLARHRRFRAEESLHDLVVLRRVAEAPEKGQQLRIVCKSVFRQLPNDSMGYGPPGESRGGLAQPQQYSAQQRADIAVHAPESTAKRGLRV